MSNHQLSITPKMWKEFQHYKHRSPPWIKLHKKLLDNYEFFCLPVASMALAPLLWLLASEYENGVILASEEKIAFRVHLSVKDLEKALAPLKNSGFFDVSQVAIDVLASCKQDTRLETEKEKEKRQIAERIIFDLNLKGGFKFKINTATMESINARFEEGFTEEDFCKVHDNQIAAWTGTDFAKYIRPETLYRPSKFQGYLNAKPVKPMGEQIYAR